MKKIKNLKVKAFTLVEMLVVLLIISVLMLLFVPNLTKRNFLRSIIAMKKQRFQN